MKDKFVFYDVDGERFSVRESEMSEFEKDFPNAKINMSVDGENFPVSISDREEFLNDFGNRASYTNFDEEAEKPKLRDRILNSAVAANDSLMRAQLGSEKAFSEQSMEKVTQAPAAVDTDMANLAIESHNQNKDKIASAIAEMDKAYNAEIKKNPEKRKSFLEKLGESPSMSQRNMGLSAVVGQQKKEEAKRGKDYTDALIAKNISDKIDDKVKQYNDPAKNFAEGVIEGLGDTVFDIETWDSTIGAEQAARVYEISKKLDNGGTLTEGEQMIVDALVDDLASDIYLAAGFGRGYKAGKVTGESLPFMVETMLNPASGFGKSVTKKFGKEIFKMLSKKVGATVARGAVHATRVGADIAGAAMMSATTSQARVAEDALNRLSGQVDFTINDDGTLGFNGFVGGEDSAFKAYSKAFGANSIEHFSEMVGNYFAPMGEMAKKGTAALANKIGLKKVNELLTEMTPNGFGSLVNDFAEQTQWHGVIGEFAEEMVSGAMNALIVGDQSLKKYDKDGNINANYLFDKDNLIDTFLGVAILGGVMSTAKTVGFTTPEARYNREISKAKKKLEGVLSPVEIAQLEAFAANPMGVDYANLTPFFDENRKEEEKRAVGNYLAAVMQKQGYLISRQADLSGTRQGMAEMRNAYQVGENMSETDLYDIDEALNQAIQEANNTGLVWTPEEVMNRSSYDLLALSNHASYTPEQSAAVRNLALVRNAQEGLNNKLNAIANAAIEAESKPAREAATNGIITAGFHNGRFVYVKGVANVANGAIVRPSDTSGHPVEIIDAITGERTIDDSKNITNVNNFKEEDVIKGIANTVNTSFQNRWEQRRNTKSTKSKLAEIEQFVGQKVFIQTPNNNMAEVEIQQILPNGEVLIKGKKGDLGGQSNIRVDVDSFYDSMTRDANGNPIFNQSEFRSQTQGIEGARNSMYVQGNKARDTRTQAQAEPQPAIEQPMSPESVIPKAPEVAPEPEVVPEPESAPTDVDFREQTVTILINGVPTEVEVTGQDNTADRITYEYTDENGVRRSGGSTIGEFKSAIQQAQSVATESPVVDVPAEDVPTTEATAIDTPTTEAPTDIQLTPEDIDWDALLEQDPENFFIELQKQFGDKSERYLSAFIAAAQSELDKINKSNTTVLKEIIANEAKKDALQSRIDTLNGMIARLSPAPVAETAPEVPTAEAAPIDETPASIDPSVPDFSADRASDARARGYRVTSGQRIDRRGETSGVYGNDIEIAFTADSKGKRSGKVKVIDAGSLIPSHISGVENVEHFLPEAQPKKRTDKASTVSASLIAQNMNNPQMTTVTTSAYEGAPVVNRRGEVIQGNNRSAALLEMYQSHPDKASEYRQYLIDHASEFGLNANDVAAMQNPVLVRELDVEDVDAINLGQYTMQDMESGGSQSIDASRAIAGLNNKGMMEYFIDTLLAEENDESSDMNISDLITRNGNAALKLLYAQGIINQTQYQSAIGSDGRITADARASLRGIIEQQLFAGGIDNLGVMFEVLPDKAKKAIMQTIARDIKNADGERVIPYIQQAIEIYYHLNQQKDFVAAKDDSDIRTAIEGYKRQTSFEDPLTPAEKYSNFAFELAFLFKARTLKEIRAKFNALYDEMSGAANLFAVGEGKSLADAVQEVYGITLNNGNYETNGQGGADVLDNSNGESTEGGQGGDGNMGEGSESSEGWQRTSDGGTDTPILGGTTGQAAGEVSETPVAPNPVANPVDVAQEEEKKLLFILGRLDLSKNEKRDWAYKFGKKIADMFTTKEDYEDYEAVAKDLGAYYSDFQRGVEESFANRSKIESESPVNSVPLESEPNGENNGEQQPVETEPATEGRDNNTTGGRADNTGNQEDGEGGKKTKSSRRGKGKKNSQQVEDKYPARKGNATQKLLVDTFGFESVTIPNSRKETLNTIYDFMMEMSKTLGISPKSIGQGGWLSIGNLRSNKKAIAAHQIASNSLTREIKEVSLRFKYARLSSIAHEWWHSLDRALGYFNTGKLEAPTSEVGETSFTGRKETWEAVKGVMDAISKSGYTARIEQLVKRQTRAVREYFLSNTEQAARAFDEYITNRFAEAGITIDNYDNHRDVTQPTAEEMKVIAPAIENLFKVLQEKEGKMPGTSILYQIGEQMDNESEYTPIVNEALDLAFEQNASVNVHRLADEEAEQAYKAAGVDPDTHFSIDTDKPIFISNAALAVVGIKQEKATPEQWLKMIEKAGGLKAGEDKWMGLSDWLKASDARTLTKQEVLNFINENTIRIEEVNYRHWEDLDYIDEATKILEAEMKEIGWDAMVKKYPNFDYLFEEYNGELMWSETRASVAEYEQFIFDDNNILDRPINETREQYTSDGVLNKKEIAIIVPTIEPWNTNDVIHFGDAGHGRAVAWVRFGDSELVEDTDESKEAAVALRELAKDAKEKYGDKRSAWPDDVRAAYDLLLEREISSMKLRKILFIDEIQSKRHQDAREQGGYRVSNIDTWLADNGVDVKESGEFYEFYKNGELDKRFSKGLLRYDIDSAKNLYVSGYAKSSIPEAPFERNWSELAMKRMLRYAAENGYDAVAWTKGAQQADRYNIGNVVNSIITADHNGNKRVRLYLRNAHSQMFDVNPDTGAIVNVEMGGVVSEGMQLSDVVGKELAVSILNDKGEVDERGYRHISGDGLRIGGEGMKGFYDKILPAFVNKYGKKWGASVSDIELPLVEAGENYNFHSVPVTEAMKASVMEGQPMFFKTPNGIVYGWAKGNDIYLTKDGLNPNTKIHEYTHLWANAMMQKNPKGWNSIKKLLKGTPIWNQVMSDTNHSDIHNDEDAVASEALSRISGVDNAAKMEQMAKQLEAEAKGTARKLEAHGLIQNMKDALNKFWDWVGTNLFGIEKFESVEQVTDRVLFDLLNSTDLGLSEDTTNGSSMMVSRELSSSNTSVSRYDKKYGTDVKGFLDFLRGGKVFEKGKPRVFHIATAGELLSKYGIKGNFMVGEFTFSRTHTENIDHELGVKEWIDVINNLNTPLAITSYKGEADKYRIYTYATINGKNICVGVNVSTKDGKLELSNIISAYGRDVENLLGKEKDYLIYPETLKELKQRISQVSTAHNSLLNAPSSASDSKDKNNVETNNNNEDDFRSRRSDVQNAAVDYLAGEPRLRAIENAVNEEASKLGVQVTYKTRSEMPAGHKNDKGYYNTKTGEIVICTENAASIADAIQTILHEAVAHRGLRQLMGDRFNEFINRVYESLDAETKAKVDALAKDKYNDNTAVAMEEYMASLAENENFAENSVWDKIKDIFNDIINSILGRNDIKIGDNQLRYILRASYNNMVNPRTMDTIEGWAKDTNMRNELGINEATPELLSRTGIDPTEVSRETARSTYDRVVKERYQEFQRQFQDAYQPVRIAIDAIQQETGNIPIEDYENYLLIQNQSSSRSRVEIDDFARRYYSPIIEQVNKIIDKIIESRGGDIKSEKERMWAYQELKNYLIAKHGLERNKYYQSTKTRPLTAYEKAKENSKAQKSYDEAVDNINADTTLSADERDAQLQQALSDFNAALAEIQTRLVPDMRDYSGLTALFGLAPKEYEEAERQAEEMIDSFESIVDTDALWSKINAATDKTLRHSYESGLLSRQQYNDIKNMFDFYIPLRGFDETTAEDVYEYARFEGNRFNPAVQTAKGRTSVADDPLAIIMNMAESEIAQGNKNKAKQALYNYLLNRSAGRSSQNSLLQIEEVWYIKSVDDSGKEVYTLAAPDHDSGETYEEFEARMQELADKDEAYKSKKGNKLNIGKRFQKPTNRNAHYAYLKVNGVEKAIYINGDPKAADAINGAYQEKKMVAEDKMRDLNRLISSTFTNYSLEFTARNYFRDMIYSHINIGIRESDPAYRKKFRQNWRHNNLGSVMKMLTAYRAGEFEGRPLTEDEAAFVEFMENGGQTGYTLINSVERHKKQLEQAIEHMRNGIDKGGVKDSTAFKYTLGAIELLNEASELVTRFAAYKTSRDMGRGINKAISDAKEITVNFNTKGAQDGKGFMGGVARYFGWSKFFFNASVQGVQQIKAMADANKLKFGTVVGGVVAAGFFMPIITAAISSLFGGDDDENEYWNIPEYDRQNNLCISVGGGKYAKIPLPIGFREVYSIGDMVAAMLMDKKFKRDVNQVGMDIANKITSVVLPINPLENASTGLNAWQIFLYTALPSSAQVFIQNATNVDWKGAPLQKEYTYNENDPQWMKAYESNPDWLTGLSKWCNEHINLDGDYEGLDWSPEKVDNLLSNLFGGIYSLVKKSGRSISMIWNEENRNLSNVPLASVVVGSGIDSDDRFVTDAYYDMKEFYDSNISSIKRRAKSFGYDLDDVFIEQKGTHHPKMQDIYNNRHFDFMQEWYKGNKEIEKMNRNIDKLEKKINASEIPSQNDVDALTALQNEYETERRDFVNDMVELD